MQIPKISITNSDGQVVKNVYDLPGSSTINVSDLNAGIYILKTPSEESVEYGKFLKL